MHVAIISFWTFLPSNRSLEHSYIMSAFALSMASLPSRLAILAQARLTAPVWAIIQSPFSSWGRNPKMVSAMLFKCIWQKKLPLDFFYCKHKPLEWSSVVRLWDVRFTNLVSVLASWHLCSLQNPPLLEVRSTLLIHPCHGCQNKSTLILKPFFFQIMVTGQVDSSLLTEW